MRAGAGERTPGLTADAAVRHRNKIALLVAGPAGGVAHPLQDALPFIFWLTRDYHLGHHAVLLDEGLGSTQGFPYSVALDYPLWPLPEGYALLG